MGGLRALGLSFIRRVSHDHKRKWKFYCRILLHIFSEILELTKMLIELSVCFKPFFSKNSFCEVKTIHGDCEYSENNQIVSVVCLVSCIFFLQNCLEIRNGKIFFKISKFQTFSAIKVKNKNISRALLKTRIVK